MVITEEIAAIFQSWKSQMGAPILEVEITDQQLCDMFSLAQGDFGEITLNYIIENQWANLYAKNLSNLDLAYALSVRTFDMAHAMSLYFSHNVGLQQHGDGEWELKKDSFEVIPNCKQDYYIPPGREINSVFFMEEPVTPAAVYSVGGLGGMATAGIFGMGPTAGIGYGGGGFPFYFGYGGMMDVGYMGQHIANMRRSFTPDVYYTVTSMKNGGHIVHLHGNPKRIGFGPWTGFGGPIINLGGCRVTYTYYDTTPENADECKRQNPEVILSPDQVPLSKLEFSLLNEPSKVTVRKLFFARATKALGFTRGKFSGRVSIMDSEAQLDYQMLITQADKEHDETVKELRERLERMSPLKIAEREAAIVEAMMKTMAGTPLKMIMV